MGIAQRPGRIVNQATDRRRQARPIRGAPVTRGPIKASGSADARKSARKLGERSNGKRACRKAGTVDPQDSGQRAGLPDDHPLPGGDREAHSGPHRADLRGSQPFLQAAFSGRRRSRQAPQAPDRERRPGGDRDDQLPRDAGRDSRHHGRGRLCRADEPELFRPGTEPSDDGRRTDGDPDVARISGPGAQIRRRARRQACLCRRDGRAHPREMDRGGPGRAAAASPRVRRQGHDVLHRRHDRPAERRRASSQHDHRRLPRRVRLLRIRLGRRGVA